MQAIPHTAIDDGRRMAPSAWRGSVMRTLLGLGLVTAMVAPAVAFNRPKKEPDAKLQACPEIGEGYVRLAGSTTCVKLGGLVRVEAAKIGGSR